MIVLDTHALYWLTVGESRLGRFARQHIQLAWQDSQLAVSAASFWEMAMLVDRGRIELPMGTRALRRMLLRDGITEIAIDGEIAIASQSLKAFHKDPADRLIVATCLRGDSLVTSDRKILDWPGSLDRINALE